MKKKIKNLFFPNLKKKILVNFNNTFSFDQSMKSSKEKRAKIKKNIPPTKLTNLSEIFFANNFPTKTANEVQNI